MYCGRRVLRVAVGIVGKLFNPKALYNRVGNLLHHFFAEGFVYEHAVDVEQCRALVLQKRHQRVGEDILHARGPGVYPNFAESGQEARYHEVALVVADILHDVKRYRVLQVEGRKIHHVFDAMCRHIFHNPVCGSAVRVDKSHSLAVADVLYGHVLQHGRLAHAGLADDVHMPAPILAAYAERRLLAAGVGGGKIGYLVRVFLHPSSISKLIALFGRGNTCDFCPAHHIRNLCRKTLSVLHRKLMNPLRSKYTDPSLL